MKEKEYDTYEPDIICVVWVDSTTFRYGWSSLPSSGIEPKSIMSCGVLVKEDEESITLSTSYAPSQGTIIYNDFFVIPKGCIKERFSMVIEDVSKKQAKRK